MLETGSDSVKPARSNAGENPAPSGPVSGQDSAPGPSAGTVVAAIRQQAVELGCDLVGITPLQPSAHGAFYRDWLARQHHGEMEYLARPDAVARRLDPREQRPELHTAIVVAVNYAGANATEESAHNDGRGIVARYARGRDYHRVIKRILLELLARIENVVGHSLPAARAYVDTGPVLERELAQRAGLGWFGRNTMLIHPKRGSFFFLGVLLVELELPADAPFEADHCGRCTACLDACPTGALLGRDAQGAPVIDATRCISYLTIEQRGPIPRDLRPAIGNRIFGCDICQDVCPWNAPKFVQLAGVPALAPRPELENPALLELFSMDESGWDRLSQGSAIRRAKRAGFLRNVAVALGNWGSPRAVPALTRALSDEEPLVRGHAAWALGQIRTPAARESLTARESIEPDDWVRSELSASLDSC